MPARPLLAVLVAVVVAHALGGAGRAPAGAHVRDPLVAAAGDIACDPTDAGYNGGAGTRNSCRARVVSDMLRIRPTAVLPLGDNQYECGALSAFRTSFDASWGRLRSISHPAVGNHDYGHACGRNSAAGHFRYFRAAAGPFGRGYYSYDLRGWHLIALNSECSYGRGRLRVRGCGAGSPQERWLRRDLAANRGRCTLAYWHEPRFSSGQHGNALQMAHIWNVLVRAHADVVLSAHNHVYERFRQLGAVPASAGATRRPDFQDPVPRAAGIREFVVGTGGKNHYPFSHPPLRGEVARSADTYGVLLLRLRPRGYTWRFLPEPGKTFTDAGSGRCHREPAGHARAGAGLAAAPRQPGFPIRAAFYYAWYPETWRVGGRYAHFHPSAGYYASAAATMQRAHIRALVYAGMDAAIASWNGPKGSADSRLRRLLAQTVRLRAPLKWAVYHEREGRADPSVAAIARDLSHIRRRLASSRAYLRVRGRFVVFVYNANDRSCRVVRRWRAANARLGRPAYLVLKVFPGYRGCRSQPDAWHQYAPASASEAQGHDAYEISPGFWKANEPAPRLDRNLPRFRRDIGAMIRSGARWQLVTTFNEWGEGTAVESAAEWATASGRGAYLDALHAALARAGDEPGP